MKKTKNTKSVHEKKQKISQLNQSVRYHITVYNENDLLMFLAVKE